MQITLILSAEVLRHLCFAVSVSNTMELNRISFVLLTELETDKDSTSKFNRNGVSQFICTQEARLLGEIKLYGSFKNTSHCTVVTWLL